MSEYKLNNGKCRNGGYPDPLKNCKCRCPEEYGGDDCTEHIWYMPSYLHAIFGKRVVDLTAKVEEQYINSNEINISPLGSHMLCFFIKDRVRNVSRHSGRRSRT
uniref:EGF-like domain-containing protein n=1 Tax=Meloidogyne incognita TaxID=6306 RepID=A0A914LHI9_MELIC